MGAVLSSLGAMAAIAVVGWLLARGRVLGEGAETVLARVVFTIAVPSLLAVTIAGADLHGLLSRVALVTALSTSAVVLLAVVVLRGVWHQPAGDATIGALCASYVNAGNLGIPIAVYLLGDAVAVVPTLLFQLLVLAPLAFAVLESRMPVGVSPPAAAGRSDGVPDARALSDRGVAATDDGDVASTGEPALPSPGSGRPLARAGRTASRTVTNPIIIGALTGVVLAALPWDLPSAVYEPFRIIGAAAAPLALLAFGMSLAGERRAGRHLVTRELALVVGLRSVVHPLAAALLGRALGLDGPALLAVVTMAALPTAQNVLVYALRYGRAESLARDAGLVTTLLVVPVVSVIATVLG